MPKAFQDCVYAILKRFLILVDYIKLNSSVRQFHMKVFPMVIIPVYSAISLQSTQSNYILYN